MTSEQISLVRDSFAKVIPITDRAAEIFYATLFQMDPSLKSLFRVNMKEQGKKLMDTIGVVVNSLDRLDKVLPVIQRLAINHVDYGVKPDHYKTVGEALLSTLEQGLGDAFTPEVKTAWTRAYTILSNTMIEAASQAA